MVVYLYFILKNYLLIIISFEAVYNNNTNLVNLLIRTGVNLNIQDKYGLTPLHYGNNLVLVNFKEFLKFDLSCNDEQS
jgi:ankyrin repeat protein